MPKVLKRPSDVLVLVGCKGLGITVAGGWPCEHYLRSICRGTPNGEPRALTISRRIGQDYGVLEVGGALSGLQFVLARAGCQVHNVDPFINYGDGDYQVHPQLRHDQLNRAFKTDVTLHRITLPETTVEGTVDVIYSVSTIEHIPPDVLEDTLVAARRLLAPGGRIVLTVDLFLDLMPYTARESNNWGTNVSAKWIADILQMELAIGDPSELPGYQEFSTEKVLEHLADCAINFNFPQLAQLMVFSSS